MFLAFLTPLRRLPSLMSILLFLLPWPVCLLSPSDLVGAFVIAVSGTDTFLSPSKLTGAFVVVVSETNTPSSVIASRYVCVSDMASEFFVVINAGWCIRRFRC